MKVNHSLNTFNKFVNVWFMGQLRYQPAYHVQKFLATRLSDGSCILNSETLDTLLIVEHLPVYTIGIRTNSYPESEEIRLKALGAEFYRTNRGGLITFHGPGQLVAYPILNLRGFNKSMKWYVCKLEETVIQLCKSLGIEAERSSDTGVWVKNNKLCAIGVHGSRYITTHGLALNCNTNMKWFSHIVPCGIPDKGVTSLSEVLGKQVTIEAVIKPFLESFEKQFQCNVKMLPNQVQIDTINHLKREGCMDDKIEMQLLREHELK